MEEGWDSLRKGGGKEGKEDLQKSEPSTMKKNHLFISEREKIGGRKVLRGGGGGPSTSLCNYGLNLRGNRKKEPACFCGEE